MGRPTASPTTPPPSSVRYRRSVTIHRGRLSAIPFAALRPARRVPPLPLPVPPALPRSPPSATGWPHRPPRPVIRRPRRRPAARRPRSARPPRHRRHHLPGGPRPPSAVRRPPSASIRRPPSCGHTPLRPCPLLVRPAFLRGLRPPPAGPHRPPRGRRPAIPVAVPPAHGRVRHARPDVAGITFQMAPVLLPLSVALHPTPSAPPPHSAPPLPSPIRPAFPRSHPSPHPPNHTIHRGRRSVAPAAVPLPHDRVRHAHPRYRRHHLPGGPRPPSAVRGHPSASIRRPPPRRHTPHSAPALTGPTGVLPRSAVRRRLSHTLHRGGRSTAPVAVPPPPAAFGTPAPMSPASPSRRPLSSTRCRSPAIRRPPPTVSTAVRRSSHLSARPSPATLPRRPTACPVRVPPASRPVAPPRPRRRSPAPGRPRRAPRLSPERPGFPPPDC